MNFFQTKLQVKTMNINFYDLLLKSDVKKKLECYDVYEYLNEY